MICVKMNEKLEETTLKKPGANSNSTHQLNGRNLQSSSKSNCSC